MSWNFRLFQRFLNTRRFGREIVHFEEVESTSAWLAHNSAQFTMTGGVVVADHQTQGRGRYERVWHDVPETALLFSLLMRYPATQDGAGFITLIPALALADSLSALPGNRPRIALKWPNDVRVNEHKVAGILGHSSLQGEKLNAIVGVGVNVTLRRNELPEAVGHTATSIVEEFGEAPAREILLAEMLNRWEPLYDEFLAGNLEMLRTRWEAFGPVRGTELTRAESGDILTGAYEGLGPRGELLLRTEDGTLHNLFSGDILP
jgi:BirA family transcriptional regulator, biotin operon repressor / biotin---[acetyl-CoA-carboxylase] ligase